MTAPAMKTIRVSLIDLQLVPAGSSGTVKGSVWCRLTQQVRTTDGQVIGLVPIWRTVPASGIVDFSVPANDDAGIVAADRGFGVVIGWDLTHRAARGGKVNVTNPGTTLYVTSASPTVASFADPSVPITDTYTNLYNDIYADIY